VKRLRQPLAHIETVKRPAQPVVCISKFYTDDEEEIKVTAQAEQSGAGWRYQALAQGRQGPLDWLMPH
jgi:hypothetical protein